MKLLSIILSIAVSASLDSTSMWIGNQTDLHLEATIEQGEQIQFPLASEQLPQGIELIEQSAIDTVRDGNQIKLRQDWTITSFQDSLYYIEPFVFVSQGDSIPTNGMALNIIQPFIIDSADNAITDIKKIATPPFPTKYLLIDLAILLLLIGLGFAAYYFISKHKWKQNKAENKKADIPLRPADEEALERLQQIREEKIWQQGKEKQYYSEITDVLREYISRVFEIGSVEMTSDEILRNLKQPLKGEEDTLKQLKDVFSLADLVKFAKFRATPEENEKTVREATDFVNNTKYRIVRENPEKEENTESNEPNNQQS